MGQFIVDFNEKLICKGASKVAVIKSVQEEDYLLKNFAFDVEYYSKEFLQSLATKSKILKLGKPTVISRLLKGRKLKKIIAPQGSRLIITMHYQEKFIELECQELIVDRNSSTDGKQFILRELSQESAMQISRHFYFHQRSHSSSGLKSCLEYVAQDRTLVIPETGWKDEECNRVNFFNLIESIDAYCTDLVEHPTAFKIDLRKYHPTLNYKTIILYSTETESRTVKRNGEVFRNYTENWTYETVTNYKATKQFKTVRQAREYYMLLQRLRGQTKRTYTLFSPIIISLDGFLLTETIDKREYET